MAGLPEKAAATRSSRKSPLVSGSPCLDNTCCRSSGRSRMFKLGFGLGSGFGPLQESPLRRPLSHVWVSIAHYCFFLLFFLFCIFVVVFVSAPASASICSLSLSLSHYYLKVFPGGPRCSLTSEIERGHVPSTRYGRQRPKWVQV
jgi:hypothetical protein